MGEATSDYLVHRFSPYLAVVGGFLVFVVAIAIQFRDAQLRPVGLLVRGRDGRGLRDDVRRRAPRRVRRPVRGLDAPSSQCRSRSSSSPGTGSRGRFRSTASGRVRRELFYWAAVLATFAMGTAVGDFAAYTLGSRLPLRRDSCSPVLFALPAIGYRFFGAERDLRVLVRLRDDPAARRLVRRLDGQVAPRRRARVRRRAGGVRAGRR